MELIDRFYIPVSGWDTEKETIVLLEDGGVGQSLDVRWLCWSVHLAEDFFGKSLLNLVEVALSTGLSDTGGLGLGQLLYVAVHGVLW